MNKRMVGSILISICLLGFAAVGPVCAGPVLDEILNYMFVDQSTPQKIPNLVFDASRDIALAKDAPLGQTFVTGPDTDRIVRVRVRMRPNSDWQPGEGAEMVLWDSPEKKVSLGRCTIWHPYRGFLHGNADFEIDARVQPNNHYYLEIGYVGAGDGKLSNFGVMNGTDAYKAGQGFLGGKESDFDLCFQTHIKRPADRVGNLKKAFSRLDLARPELASVKAAVDREDWEAAIAGTVAYFEDRQRPVSFIDPKHVVKLNPSFDTTDGDLAMLNYFQGGDIGTGGYAGPDVNWGAMPLFNPDGTIAANDWDPNRFGPRGTLTKCYFATGNEKYIKKLNDLLLDWYIDNPPPGDSRIGGPGPDQIWSSLQTGIRLDQGTIAYSMMHSSPSFTVECRFASILSWADHADTLVSIGEGAGGNWSFTQNSAMFRFALNFPEFTDAGRWQETALRRLSESVRKDWLPDGVETESSLAYQRYAYGALADLYRLARERGLQAPLLRDMSVLLEKQAEYFMYATMPNGVHPFLGDWEPGSQIEGLRTDSELYGRPDMIYVSTLGKEGTKPKDVSKLYPYAGLVTMRSDWGDAGRPFADARYLMLHGVHYGSHGHQDLNGIIGLYAYGRELICDPGSHVYGSAEHRLLCTSPSHNLVTIDGEDQNDSKAQFRNWATTPIADYLSSWVDAYGTNDYARTREVFYIRTNADPAGDYWVVRDAVGGTGTHSLEQRWHFAPGQLKVDKVSLTAQTAFQDKGNLAVMQIDPSRLRLDETITNTWRRHPGDKQTEDWRGELPTATYVTKAALPAAIGTVLFPFEGQPMPDVKLKVLETSPDGLASAFKIVQGSVQDLFVLQRAPGKKDVTGERVSFDGERAFVRRVGGKIRSVLLVNGSSLTVDGKQLIRSPKPVSWVAVSFDASGVQIYTGSDRPDLTVPAAEGRKTVVTNTHSDELIAR